MSQLGSSELERMKGQAVRGALIDEDRSCGECGYDLKWLRIGGTCPECGTPITQNRRRAEPPMGEAPADYLLQMALGTTLMALGGLGWVAFLVIGPLLRLFAGIVFSMHPLLIGALSIVWGAGVLLCLRERPFAKEKRFTRGGKPEWWTLRIAIAGTQVFAFGIGLSYWMFVRSGAMSIWWAAAFTLCLLPTLVGWALLSVYLSRLAYWAGDDELGGRLHAMALWLGIVGALASLVAIRPLAMFGAIAVLIYVFLSVLLMLMVLRMSSTVRWAERNAANARERDRRMVAKARAEMERERAKRMGAVASGSGGLEMSAEQEAMLAELERKQAEMEARGEDETPVQRAPSGGQHMIESSEDVEAFGLEGDGSDGAARG